VARLLVVNGDDFGLTPGVNAGILHAHRCGILTSASLFANEAATDDAIEIARRTPSLGIGVHLTLVDGQPLLPAAAVPTLAPDGSFRPTWGAFIHAALTGRIRLDDVERELSAQIERVATSGVTITHLDGHKHVHAYPPVFAIVVRLARRFGIDRVRVPCERRAVSAAIRWAATAGARRQAAENVALAPWAARDRRILIAEGLPPAAAFTGRALTGIFTRRRLIDLIERLPHGVTELMTHPGYVDTALHARRTRLRDARAVETALLADRDVLDAVTRAGIVLVRHDLLPVAEPYSHAS